MHKNPGFFPLRPPFIVVSYDFPIETSQFSDFSMSLVSQVGLVRPEAAAPWIASGLQPLWLLGVGRGSHVALQSGGGSWAKLLWAEAASGKKKPVGS